MSFIERAGFVPGGRIEQVIEELKQRNAQSMELLERQKEVRGVSEALKEFAAQFSGRETIEEILARRSKQNVK